MTSHVIALAGPKDTFTVAAPQATVHVVPFDIAGHPLAIVDSTPQVLAANALELSIASADVLRFAVAAYAADTHLARKPTFDRWTRDIRLYLPVSDIDAWEAAREQAAALLAFLTGDHWELEVRKVPDGYAPGRGKAEVKQKVRADAVCLFSGGLDSFIGAVDALEAGVRLALVGHHAKGTGATSGSQNSAITVVRSSYEIARTPFLRFWISPPKGPGDASETTTRGRSLLFIGLGLVVASAAGATRLIVPENGFISLNVPLTNSRLGSFSTRTTHPHFINLVRQLVAAVNIPVHLQLPYRFQTKGEMVAACANQAVLARGVPSTMSCSHPESNRFRAHDPTAHCGRCVPCIIRRAALAGVTDTTKYVHADLAVPLAGKSGSDLRAIKLALNRYQHAPPGVAEVLAAGPLPGTDDERAAYVEVFRRGVAEVRSLLRGYDGGE
jgi:7-cyano-7-deazaguanine synthase in queuosine biosynthesis